MKIFIGQKPDRQHMQALQRCKLENSALMDLFRKRLEETKDSLILADDLVRIHRLQGRAEVLSDFLEAVEKSPEIFDRVK
jgi:undecaprenyl pyrophosphate synthase